LQLWPDPGLIVVESFAALMRGRIEAIGVADVLDAARAAETFPALSAGDLLHLAVAQRVGSHAVVSADRDFEGLLSGIERLDPADISLWIDRVT
jgi:predicted nucleic acid-binding protein